jgi:hypothetical protein
MGWVQVIIAIAQALPVLLELLKLIMAETKSLPKAERVKIQAEVKSIAKAERLKTDDPHIIGERLKAVLDRARAAK